MNNNLSPDFVGKHPLHDWIVVEAKGRSSGGGGDAFPRMREQKEAVDLVDGNPPIARFGLMASYSEQMPGPQRGLRWRAIDPPEPFSLQVNEDQVVATYFGHVAALFDAAATADEQQDDASVSVHMPGADVVVSADAQILQQVRQLNSEATGFASFVRERTVEGAEATMGHGLVSVELGPTWQDRRFKSTSPQR